MKITKKLITLALAALMLLSLAVPAAAADDVITKVNITKTNIKTGLVENLGGCGRLQLFYSLVDLPGYYPDGMIDKTGNYIDPQNKFTGFFYDPDSRIISCTTDDIYMQVTGPEGAPEFIPTYYNMDGSVAFSLPSQGNTSYESGPMNSRRAVVVETTKSGSDVKTSLYVVNEKGEKVFTIPDAASKYDDEGYYVRWEKTLYNYSDGLAVYHDYSQTDKGLIIKYLDTSGKVVLDVSNRDYEDAYSFSDGLALVSKKTKWPDKDYAYIDKTGKEVISLGNVDYASWFHNGLACVSTCVTAADGSRSYKKSYIDKTGKTVLTSDYILYYEAGDGLYTAENNEKYGLINIKGEVVVPFEYDVMSVYDYGVAYALKDGYVYIITGEESAPETPAAPSFTDVPADAWYAAPVAWAVEKEITNGTGNNKFSPNKTCNNSEILTFLWRACGKPEAPAASFTDVASGVWYADAANWAKSKGMVSGDKLSPTEPCTRASAVMYIWQAMGKPAASKAASFSDVDASSDYAAAVAWAVEKGVTNGTGADTFSPDTICTRAQIVTFLQRAYA